MARSADPSASAQSPATVAVTAASACMAAAVPASSWAMRSASSVSDSWLARASLTPPLSRTSASRCRTAARSSGCGASAIDSSSATARS